MEIIEVKFWKVEFTVIKTNCNLLSKQISIAVQNGTRNANALVEAPVKKMFIQVKVERKLKFYDVN